MTTRARRPSSPSGLLRSVALVRRRADLDWPEFSRHWREEHAAIARALDGMTSYVQAHARPELQPAGLPASWRYDGAALAGFADLDALERMRADAGYRARAVVDEAEFVDRASMAAVLLVDGWVEPTPAPDLVSASLLLFVRGECRLDPQAGRTLVADLGDVTRSAVGSAWSLALDRDPGLAPGGGEARAYDALLELWFTETVAATDAADRLVAAAPAFPVGVAACLVTRENRVV
ncbi:EthD domain-containing protein [Nocardioides humi]|uniref:EthD domain-containing protein n=1 Tax=Nocardioides humi TaxID=449461 RepID=A0ABN2AHK2_9ACTN|nr:EthD domain-containing protein [Nocardioides humi]